MTNTNNNQVLRFTPAFYPEQDLGMKDRILEYGAKDFGSLSLRQEQNKAPY